MRIGPHRILVIEDNPADVRLIKEALRYYKVDFELAHFSTADAAISAIDKFESDAWNLPDLILLDYNVPRGDGCDILSAASRNPALAGVPRVVVTSSIAAKDREQAMELGAQCFIIKPSDLDGFLKQVGTAIVKLLETGSSAGRDAAKV